ncbi:TetR/AcrR family transcriptional regulator [Phenylobacterium sp.]|jgi:AcrR family transcriptional regulator|uniref:TetR/AcrR family transcriptional regulator n=1 Tax=Phenylobacterium sp. TaxID=1871053 RepID=UPI002E37A0A1|nr:TetR/AcrR family transcriptional regulator [Phenylobacterium sp.]HEX3364820.1 TetR/AcrR family transcriptional regulator [Phenylobacterium sp.]
MARPKAFDRDTALQAALDVFWTKGYAGASTDDLTVAMGIGRQSLYDTFGDKRRLYLEALTRYNTENVAGHLAALRNAASATDAIEGLLLRFANEPEPLRARGCMGINAICEFGQDPDVSAAGRASGELLEANLVRLLETGKAAGDVDSAVDPRSAARFIAATLAGLKVQAKAGAPADVLREVAAFAVGSLKPR